jgi:hypothetical protein
LNEKSLSLSNRDLDIYSRLNIDAGDLSNHFSRGVKIQDALVNAHLKAIVGVGSLTARRLADYQLEDLGWHSHRASDLDSKVKGLVLQLGTHLFQRLNLGGSEGDADAVDGDFFGLSGLNIHS